MSSNTSPRKPRKEKEPPTDRQCWTLQEFCREFRVSRSNVYVQIRSGKLRTILLGGRRLIPVSEGERLLSGGEAR